MKVSEEILQLKPYTPGKPIEETQREYGLTKVYKLASNENPLGPSPKACEAIQKMLSQLHRYPDAAFFDMRQYFSKKYQVEPHQITFGNGSNELIDLVIRVFCAPKQKVLTSANAFVAYKVSTQAARAELVEVPMSEDLTFDLDVMAEKVLQADSNGEPIPVVFIANPNNPTGTYVNELSLVNYLEKVKACKDTLTVIDEAYIEFVRAEDYPDALALFRQYPNVAIMRTLSKVYGIAGLRIGCLVATSEVVELVDRVRAPFNVNLLAQVAAPAALEDSEFLQKVQQLNWQGLDYFAQQFQLMGLKYWPSQANFVLIDTGLDGSKVFQELLKKGVIVRPVFVQGKNSFLRISVGLPEENEAAIAALKQVIEKFK